MFPTEKDHWTTDLPVAHFQASRFARDANLLQLFLIEIEKEIDGYVAVFAGKKFIKGSEESELSLEMVQSLERGEFKGSKVHWKTPESFKDPETNKEMYFKHLETGSIICMFNGGDAAREWDEVKKKIEEKLDVSFRVTEEEGSSDGRKKKEEKRHQ